jgi:hypothetical protein
VSAAAAARLSLAELAFALAAAPRWLGWRFTVSIAPVKRRAQRRARALAIIPDPDEDDLEYAEEDEE